jgi:hypothetical protein
MSSPSSSPTVNHPAVDELVGAIQDLADEFYETTAAMDGLRDGSAETAAGK